MNVLSIDVNTPFHRLDYPQQSQTDCALPCPSSPHNSDLSMTPSLYLLACFDLEIQILQHRLSVRTISEPIVLKRNRGQGRPVILRRIVKLFGWSFLNNVCEIDESLERDESALVEDEQSEHPNNTDLDAEERTECETHQTGIPVILVVNAQEESNESEAPGHDVESDGEERIGDTSDERDFEVVIEFLAHESVELLLFIESTDGSGSGYDLAKLMNDGRASGVLKSVELSGGGVEEFKKSVAEIHKQWQRN